MLLVAFATAVAGGVSGLYRAWYILTAGAGLPPGPVLVLDMPANWLIVALSAIWALGLMSLLSAPRFAGALFLAAALGYGLMVTGYAVPASIFLAMAAGSALMVE